MLRAWPYAVWQLIQRKRLGAWRVPTHTGRKQAHGGVYALKPRRRNAAPHRKPRAYAKHHARVEVG